MGKAKRGVSIPTRDSRTSGKLIAATLAVGQEAAAVGSELIERGHGDVPGKF